MSLVKSLRKKYKTKCFTTPSHSQQFFITSKFEQFYKFDVSETDTHNPQEALEKAEEQASNIYGVNKTLFLINGSTSGVIASVLSCVNRDEKVLVWSNSHICHKNAVELAGGTPVFYELEKDNNWSIYKSFEPKELEKYLEKENIKAVIVTSPSYYGVTSDVKSLKKVCEKYGTYLIVDEAHGALYPFSNNLPESAVNIADFTIQSLHKTAGGLNPTALLHTNTNLDIKSALAKIQTTSPSYPLLMSIEKNINYLNSQKGREKIEQLIKNIQKLKSNCENLEFFDGDITKIVVKKQGLSGYELSKFLYDNGIEDEKTNEISTMLLCGLGTSEEKLRKLERVFRKI